MSDTPRTDAFIENSFRAVHETETWEDFSRRLERELSAAHAWKEAVIDELIVDHIYTKEHETNPRKAIQDAITWNCQVALDPAVSSDARALIAAAIAARENP